MDVGLRDRTTLKLFGYAFTTWYQILFDLPLFETFWITVVSSCWILLCLVVLGCLSVSHCCAVVSQWPNGSRGPLVCSQLFSFFSEGFSVLSRLVFVVLGRSRSSRWFSSFSELLGATLDLLGLLLVVSQWFSVAPTVSQVVLGCFPILDEVLV